MPNIILIQNDYLTEQSLSKVLNYVTRSAIIDGYAVDPRYAYQQMKMIKKASHKEDGVQLKHFIIAFSHEEAFNVSMDDLMDLGFQIGSFFREYQMVYAVHLDSSHLHLHCVMNTVSFLTGHKYSNGHSDFWGLKSMLQHKYPNSIIGLYTSFPNSRLNRFSFSDEDYILKLD